MESLYEAWERFKDLLRKCPHHGLPTPIQVQTFYNGISPANRSMIDAVVGGIITRTPKEACNFLGEMASNSDQCQTNRSVARGVHGLDTFAVLSTQREALNKKIDSMSVSAIQVQCANCGLCRGHANIECQVKNPYAQLSEHANFFGDFHRQLNNPYSNTYFLGWRNHPNFS